MLKKIAALGLLLALTVNAGFADSVTEYDLRSCLKT